MKKGFFLTTFSIVFLDLLGVSVVIPILAPLFLNAGGIMAGATLAQQTITLGLLLASYPLAQFFGAPILGALSDKHGRKKILQLSLIGTAIGYAIFAIGIIQQELWMLFLGRSLDGFTGGNISVVLSAIADVSSEKEKAANFGLIGMAFGLGFVIGPFVGGTLANPELVSWFSFATPFWLSGLLACVNLALVSTVFHETLQKRRETPVSVLTGFRNLGVAFKMPNLRLIFSVVFLQALAFSFFTQFSQVFFIQKFAMDQTDIGMLFAFVGLWIAITQGVLVRIAAKWVSPSRTLLFALPLTAIALVAMLISPTVFWIYITNAFVAIFVGFVHPNLTAEVSNHADEESQGEILGINQSINAAALAIPSIISGFIVVIHMNLPMLMSSIVMFIAWVLYIFSCRAKKETFHEV